MSDVFKEEERMEAFPSASQGIEAQLTRVIGTYADTVLIVKIPPALAWLASGEPNVSDFRVGVASLSSTSFSSSSSSPPPPPLLSCIHPSALRNIKATLRLVRSVHVRPALLFRRQRRPVSP